MNGKRYLSFGAISLALHSLILGAKTVQNEPHISIDSTVSSINIQFVSLPSSAEKTAVKQSVNTTVAIEVKRSFTESTEPSLDEPTAPSSVKPVESSIVKPIEQAIAKPVEQAIAKPVEQAIAKPVEQAIAKPVEPSVAKSVQQTTKKPLSLKQEIAINKQVTASNKPNNSAPKVAAVPETDKNVVDTKTVSKNATPKTNREEAVQFVKKPFKPANQLAEPTDETTEPFDSTTSPSTTANNRAHTAQTSTPKLLDKPTFKAKPTPVSYPRLAKRRGQQGKVLVEVWIDQKGQQIKQFIVDSSGYSALDEAALNAISNWQFTVSVEQGYSIAHRVRIPVTFKLDR
ncbi:energy transducer TonB [Vibrio sp. TH_r3]|uniref:energy transducer TonB n=1 Tax=Vibrio sp. TH_r3 TaxID=3082084 RepID=UPI002954FC57|nr:energy transducer TonB [Vibrio sp. TH_r3]MDV7103967.1 energy transducer TonB [Vibrio sp. TH_r3]